MKILNRIYNPINVEYMGVFMPIPPDVKFLATDKNGELYGYSEKPHLAINARHSWIAFKQCTLLATIDLEGKDWRESMVAL